MSGVEALTRKVPQTDVLVNNLGIFEAEPFADIRDADWLPLFKVNVLSGMRGQRRPKVWGAFLQDLA